MRYARLLVTCLLTLSSPLVLAQLLIGQTAGFSGPVAAGVQETTDGARLYLNAVNLKGGVYGQKIELISMDDRFEPVQAAANAKALIEDKAVLALFLTRGTPHAEAMLPLLAQHGVALVAPSTGAMVLHQPVLRQVFNVRATYQREAEKAVDHLVNMGMQRIAVVHADDSFGKDGLAGARKGFERARITPTLVQPADRAKPDFAALVAALTKANAQAVLWIASGNSVAGGVAALREAGSGAQVITLSNNASAGFIKSLGKHARGVVVTQVFPSERALALPLVREANDLARANKLDGVSPAMLEGFAGAKVLVEGLRRAGPKPTRDKLLNALDSLGRVDLGGLELSYSASDHTGLEFTDLSIIGADGKFLR